MAQKTITIDTDEWKFPDRFGIQHTVKNAETFTFELTDGGASAVTYAQDKATSVLCDDGRRIHFRQQAGTPGTAGAANLASTFGPTADAQDGVKVYGLAGELACQCPESGTIQYFRCSDMTVDDIDTPTAISGRFEDQFGNSFTWTTVTVS